MRIARRFAVASAALSACLVATVVQADQFTLTDDPNIAESVVVTYDPETGNISYMGNDLLVSSMDIRSASNSLIPENVNDGVVVGPFDVMSTAKFFRLDVDGVPSIDVGPILPAGMSGQALVDDTTVGGSIKPAGLLKDAPGGGPYLYVVPEPSSLILALGALLGLLGMRRK